MANFNLEKEVRALINDFNTIDFNNVISVMGWFFEGMDFSEIFGEQIMSNFVYNQLKDHGYYELENPTEELEEFNQLMSQGNAADAERVGKSIISQIMFDLKNDRGIGTRLRCLIQMYNESFNKEFAKGHMVKNLEKNVGEPIVLFGFANNERFSYKGVLNEVLEGGNAIMIDQQRYPLVAENLVITAIYSNEDTCLYLNSFVKGEYNTSALESLEEMSNTSEEMKRAS